MLTFTERAENDNVRIVPELTETRNREDNGAWTWKVALASDINGGVIEVTFGNSVSAGDSTPDPIEVLSDLVSNAVSIEGVTGYRDFIDWARELYDFPDDYLKSGTVAWDWVERAQETYTQTIEYTNKLRTFLGIEYHGYLYETEFDV